MNDAVQRALRDLGASELIDGLEDWKGVGPSPYELERLTEFGSLSEAEARRLHDEHEAFKARLEILSPSVREELKQHALASFWHAGPSADRGCYRIDETVKLLKKLPLPDDPRILDVGSSHGLAGLLHIAYRHEFPATLVACDVLPCNLKLLAVLGFETFFVDARHALATNDPARSSSFDVVMCNETLEHIDQESEDALLEAMVRWVKPDGSLIVTFPQGVEPSDYDARVDPLGHRRQPLVERVSETTRNAFRTSLIEGKTFVTAMVCDRVAKIP